MIYEAELTSMAIEHLKQWRKSGQKKVLLKFSTLLEELRIHLTTGTGQIEQLRGNLSGLWSRQIDNANRLVYKISDEKVIVTVVSLKGHY